MTTDMNQLIRERRRRSTVETEADSGVDPAFAAAAWRAHLDEQFRTDRPGFGKNPAPLAQRPVAPNERLRAMFDNRPRARGSYRVGSEQ